jgi:hypothetical protein
MFEALRTVKKMQNLLGAKDKGQPLQLLGKRENLLEGLWLLERPGRKNEAPRQQRVPRQTRPTPFR